MGGGVLVEGWVADEFWCGERNEVRGGRCGGADGKREDGFCGMGKGEGQLRAAEGGR